MPLDWMDWDGLMQEIRNSSYCLMWTVCWNTLKQDVGGVGRHRDDVGIEVQRSVKKGGGVGRHLIEDVGPEVQKS